MTPLQKSILNAVKRRPMTLRELQNNLQVDNSRLRTTVSAMVATGELSMRNGTYVPGFATYENAAAPNTIPCTLVKLAARFGFASRDDGEGDIFIPGRALHGAMPNDKINVKLFDHPRVEGSSEGEVVEVTVPNNRFAGTVCLSEDGRMAVEPDGCRDVKFLLAKQGSEGVHLGDKVGFLITHRGNRHSDHRAAVVEKFGSSDYASECAKAILYGRSVRQEFPPEVLEEARAYDNATIDPAEVAKRLDLRGIPIFTIDSAETKDIDDAISLQKLDDGYELGVHIADVSHYVRPGSALNEEAFERATSIYYADKVIPMLPTQLSNGICSLNEGEDRLAFSCLMRLDENGEIRSYKFVKSVICSRVKGVYKEINALLEPEEGVDLTDLKTKYEAVLDQLPTMDELYRKRLVLRKARGAMDIESNEAKLVMDENGRCIDIVKRDRGTSECMIEEFMLLANQCAANAGRTNKAPFVYRVHEAPDAEKMEKLSATLLACGLNAKFKNPIPTQLELAALLDETRGQPIQIPVHTGILRSMQKARYAPQPLGHYGLVLADYAHFTSPIRRYPDLAIHRIMTDLLKGTEKETMILRYTDFAERASKQSSEREVIAMQIERKAEDCYKAEYARRHLGECYEGTISGVTQRGLFIELDNGVEGFVPASSLTPSGTSLTEGVRLTDPASGKTWSLGDKMMITIVRADVNLGKIDFEVAPAAKA
uniref:ribonuclease R n=1 Tax=Gemmiger formicilis TaxID=745368 RepID=UPI0040262A01